MITCTKCQGESSVLESRTRDNTMRRRRQCDGCGNRWSTIEVPAPSMVVGDPQRLPRALPVKMPCERRLLQDIRRILARHGLPPDIAPKMMKAVQ